LALFRRSRLFAPRGATLLLATLLVVSCANSSGEAIHIGLAGSFSDPIGLPMKLAAELAVEEINATGGINGHKVELVTKDDYADPDSAVFVANDLYASGVSAVVSAIVSAIGWAS